MKNSVQRKCFDKLIVLELLEDCLSKSLISIPLYLSEKGTH